MDSNNKAASSPETAPSPLVSGSGSAAYSPVLIPSFDDSLIRNSVKIGTGTVSGSSDDGGEFVSGNEWEVEEEEFETTAVPPSEEVLILPVSEKFLEGGDSVEFSKRPMSEEVLVWANNGGDDDDENKLVGDEGGKGSEIVGGKNGTGVVVDGEGDVFFEVMEGSEVVSEKLKLDEDESESSDRKEVGEKEVNPSGVLEAENETNDVKSMMSQQDSAVETLHVDLLGRGVAVLGDAGPIKETSDVTAVADDAFAKRNWGPTEVEVSADESGIVDAGDGRKEINAEMEAEADTGIKQIEPAVETAIDKLHAVANDKSYGGVGEGNLAIESAALAVQMFGAHQLEHLEDKQAHNGAVNEELENEVSGNADLPQVDTHTKTLIRLEAGDEEKHDLEEGSGNEVSVSDGETEGRIFGNSEAAKQFLEELEQGSAVASQSAAESLNDHLQRIDGQIVTDSDEEVDTDEEGDGKPPFDSAALAALLKAATAAGSDSGTITVTSEDASRLFSVERPAGLGSSLLSVKPAPRSNRPNLFSPPSITAAGNSDNLSEEEKKKLEKLQQLRVKFLRLVHRLGCSPEESVAAQVLYRLALLAGRPTNQMFSLDAAKMRALQLDAEENDDLDFSLNILVLGKTGMGKSATINSIFGEEKSSIHAFEPATAHVKEISGVVDGVKIKVIDSPGLKPCGSEQGANRRILSSIKKFMKKCSPDIVLYVDRLDTQTRDLNDLPMLRSITSYLGSSVWRNAIVTLTHAASAPPDGPSGSPLSYEVFVAQRSHLVQQSIGQAVGDLRLMNPSLMNPVTLVENHPSCRKNRDGHKVLPNGQSWRPQLLLLCYSMKILSEASSLTKPQDPFDHRKLFGLRARSPPLPYLLSWLLQSRSHPKLSTNQGADSIDSDIDLDDFSESDREEDDDEYDQLPPFKPLRKAQIAKLSKEQRKAYFEEYEYRVKLLQKKQWREELKRMREIKKKGKVVADQFGYMGEDADAENEGPAAVAVPLPDMVLPPSFDGDNPAYRYRFLEPTSQFLARPVLDNHSWDHDCGYDGVNIEHSLAMANRFPAAVTVQVTKDKKEFNIHLDSSISAKHGENGSSMVGFDIQNIGKQLAYILRGETKFKNLKRNKTAAGVSVTFLGENVATGFKLEDQVALGKRLMLVGSTGTVRSRDDSAYGANLEVRLREGDYPIGQDQSSLSLSLVKWRGDLALGANVQSQFSVGRNSKIAVHVGLNNKMSGQVTIRTSSSDQLQIALAGLLPIAMAIYKHIRPGVSENYSIY